MKSKNIENPREVCYSCYRPKNSCMCKYIRRINTNTKFIIIMHPKEFQKTKNGTGRLTKLSIKECELFIGIDFTNHKVINSYINNTNYNCFVLYPGDDSIKLNTKNISEPEKKNVIFIIDSTWPCSKKILRVSENLRSLPKISFDHTKTSNFKIKTQPNPYCLSTIESTHCVLELLNFHGIENIPRESLDNFLKPFEKMVDFQIQKVVNTQGEFVRYKKPCRV